MKQLLSAILCLYCIATLAAPVRPVRSSLFLWQAPAPNGPPPDPIALQGQWFVDTASGEETVSAWEFHDDHPEPFAIAGRVINIMWGTNVFAVGYTNIVGFTIEATVINNLTLDNAAAGSSSNSHFEVQMPPQPICLDTLKRPRITAEFAVAEAGQGGPPWIGIAPNPAGWPGGLAPPYYGDPGSPVTYVIEAMNEPLAAWYCFEHPLQSNPQNPPGAYYVPAWELEDIPPGDSRTVIMDFKISPYGGGYAEMPPTDIRYCVIKGSYEYGWDIFYNRSASLKISHWIDLILFDNYQTQFISSAWDPFLIEELQTNNVDYVAASDVSVFFDTVLPGEKALLSITPIATNQSPDAIQLDWNALDATDYHIQYCDTLASNTWQTIFPGLGVPPIIPAPMSWVDDGTIITNLPVWQSPERFYRLVTP